MLCENCGKNYANIRYTQIINGDKKEIAVCEECSKKLGIDHLDFDMPIDFSSYLSDFFGEYENSTDFFPFTENANKLFCKNCNMTFDEFLNKGKFGCKDCYETFKSKIDPLLKKIHGANRHVGRLGNIRENNEKSYETEVEKQQKNSVIEELDEVKKLQLELNEAIKEEKYEKAAKIRDKIKKLKKEDK